MQPCPLVLYVVTADWWFALHRTHLAEAARRAGYRVVVATDITPRSAPLRAAGFELVQLRIRRSSMAPWWLAAEWVALVRLYRRLRPQLVHHLALKPSLLGSLAAAATRTRPVVNNLTGLGWVFTDPAPAGLRALRRVVLPVLRLAFDRRRSRVVVENSDDVDQLTTDAGVGAGRIVLIPSVGVDVGRFPPVPEPDGVPVASLVGRMTQSKGVREFVAAARLLARRGVEVRMRLVGAVDEDSRDAVPEAQLRAWEAEGVVEWQGWRDDMPAVWAETTVAVLPSYREGVPVSLLEAAASGRALVATDVPGCRDVVVDGATGLLVPPRDPEALAQAIAAVLRDPDRRRAMARSARELVERRFTMAAVQEQTLALYDDLIRHASP